MELRTRRRLRPMHVVWVALALLIYALPLTLFLREGGTGPRRTAAPAGQLGLSLDIAVAELTHETVSFHVSLSSGPMLDENGRLKSDVTLDIDPGTGPVTHTFTAGSTPAPWTVKAVTETGDPLDYPFDRYAIEMDIEARAGGQVVRVAPQLGTLPHGLRARLARVENEGNHTAVIVSVRRAGTIVFMTLLMTVSLLLVSISNCTVAAFVVTRDRKLEFGMLTWSAALLFVIPAVRNVLPGAPPPGALIDFLIFFWLQIAIVIAMSALVLTWLRRRD